MHHSFLRLRRAPVAVAVAGLLTAAWAAEPPSAHASGFTTAEFGSDQGNPALGNVYSIYFNPGALAGMQGTMITADGVIAIRSVEYDRSTSALSPSDPSMLTNQTYVQANTGKATLTNVLAAPFVGFATDFGGTPFRLGVAGYVPFGGQVHWGKNNAFAGNMTVPGAYDGPQRWDSISTNLSSLYGTVAGAYRFERLHLGVGANFSVVYTTLVDDRAKNVDGSDDIFSPNGTNKEGRSLVDVSGVQVAASLGVWWQPLEALRLGVSYTSAPNFGTMRLSGTFQAQPGGVSAVTAPANGDLLQAYPDIIRLGGAYHVTPQLEVRLDGNWTRWSNFKNQCVVFPGKDCTVDANGNDTSMTSPNVVPGGNLPRNFKDTVKVRGGVGYWVLPNTEAFGSIAVETPPVSSRYIDALVFDSTRLYGTLGARHMFGDHFGAMLAATYVYLLPMEVDDSQLNTFQGVSKGPSANGHYSGSIVLFDVSASYKF
jgi:long-chain fatty acid transport protein